MKAIVTGGAGFIGSHLADRLIADGHHVTVLDDLSSGRADNLSGVLGSHNLVFRMVDLLDVDALSDSFSGADWVFHLAASRDGERGDEASRHMRCNVQATFNVLECARRYRVGRLIYAASASSYGDSPTPALAEREPLEARSVHSLTKGIGEELVLHWAMARSVSALSLRLFHVYGPRSPLSAECGSVVSVFLSQRCQDAPLTVHGDGETERDFVHVDDVCQAFVRAAERPLSGLAINIGSGRSHSILSLAEIIGGERIHVRESATAQRIRADITRARRLLDWEPRIHLEEGLAQLLDRIEDWRDAPVWSAPESDPSEQESNSAEGSTPRRSSRSSRVQRQPGPGAPPPPAQS